MKTDQYIDMIRSKTKCDVKMKIIKEDLVYYGLSDGGIPFGVFCLHRGIPGFALDLDLNTVELDQVSYFTCTPIEESISYLAIFKEYVNMGRNGVIEYDD